MIDQPTTETGQDYYAELAARLHQVADRIATLADTVDLRPTVGANLYLSAGYNDRQADVTVPVVDAIAAALGGKAETTFKGGGSGRTGEHKARVKFGALSVITYAYVPAPPTRQQKLADLERENDELRARLAAQRGEQS